MTTIQKNELEKLRSKRDSNLPLTENQLRRLAQLEQRARAEADRAAALQARRERETERREEEKRARQIAAETLLVERMARVEACFVGRLHWSLRQSMASTWKRAHASVVEFTEKVVFDPDHTFEWADSTITAAATRGFLDQLFDEDVSDEQFTEKAIKIRDWLRDCLLRNEWRQSSTGNMHRSMDAARQEAAVSLLRELTSAIDHHQKEQRLAAGDLSAAN